jgi:hypothetical protein
MNAETFSPYEERLILAVDEKHRSLLEIPNAFWEDVSAAAGARILSSWTSAEVKHFLLSASSLLIFERSILLLTCSTGGVGNALKLLCQGLQSDGICGISLEKRFPPGSTSRFEKHMGSFLMEIVSGGRLSELALPCAHRYECARKTGIFDDATSLLFFSPDRRNFTSFRVADIGEFAPGVLPLEHTFADGGYSCNLAWAESSYLTVHYSPGVYLSIDFRAAAEAKARLKALFQRNVRAAQSFLI